MTKGSNNEKRTQGDTLQEPHLALLLVRLSRNALDGVRLPRPMAFHTQDAETCKTINQMTKGH